MLPPVHFDDFKYFFDGWREICGVTFAGVWSCCALVYSWQWGLQGGILLIFCGGGIGNRDGFFLILFPKCFEAGCDFCFRSGDEPVAVGEGGLGAEFDEADGGEVDAGSGGGIGGFSGAMGAEVPGLGGGAEDGDALSSGFKAGHGLAWGGGDSPGWTDGLGDGFPFTVALVCFEGVEVAGEIAGRDFLGRLAGRAPAVAGGAFGDEFAANGDDVGHTGDEGGPLLHEGLGFLVRHVPEFWDGLSVEGLFFVEVFEFGNSGPGSDAAPLDGIP